MTCECIAATNEMLAQHNTAIITNLFGPPRCTVATYQVETGRGKKRAAIMMASFCPFCGVQYPENAK